MIVEVNIKNNKKNIELIVDNIFKDVRFIYIDEYSNRKNYLSEDPSLHSFKFNKDEILYESSNTKSIYNISSTLLNKNRISGLYILTVFFNDGSIEHRIIYDLNELYCIRVNYLFNDCNICTENANTRMLTILMFRELLLRNAIALNLIDDALNYFTDIKRNFCNNLSNINTCSSGLCNI